MSLSAKTNMEAAQEILGHENTRYANYFLMQWPDGVTPPRGGVLGGHPIGGFKTLGRVNMVVCADGQTLGFYNTIPPIEGQPAAILIASDYNEARNPDGTPCVRPELPSHLTRQTVFATEISLRCCGVGFGPR